MLQFKVIESNKLKAMFIIVKLIQSFGFPLKTCRSYLYTRYVYEIVVWLDFQ